MSQPTTPEKPTFRKWPGCRCKPCKTCGYKHYCNVGKPHPGGWYRLGACPPAKAQMKDLHAD